MSKDLDLLNGLQEDAVNLRYKETGKLDSLIRRTEMIIRNIFGNESKYIIDLKRIRFTPIAVSTRTSDDSYRESWIRGIGKLRNLIQTMIDEITLFGTSGKVVARVVPTGDSPTPHSIFIVHGHDEEMKQSVARVVEKLGLKPIILHEQTNSGKTVIEKFIHFGENALFAIVLLSPDDLAYQAGQDPSSAKFRARQNVILELGFFLGKLGRSHVIALHKVVDKFEMPSDYDGVLFVPYDDRGYWKIGLAKELRSAGINVDANNLA